jgi:putative PEP-CTERM system histidine kinase
VQFLELDQDAPANQNWKKRFPSAWLIVPIRFQEQLIAFALLQKPRAPRKLDWEDRNLLSVIVLELGAHLIHEHIAHTLSESQQLTEFNKRVTFAVHDLKNSGGQLKLLAHNVERFGHEAEFRADMLSTINHVADKLDKLIERLRTPDELSPAPSEPQIINLLEMVAKIACKPSNRPVRFPNACTSPRILVSLKHPAALESALEHVIANASEASPEGAVVEIRAVQRNGQVSLEVIDAGSGMSEEFIAEQLFRPFHTTKPGGLGIGAYQARALLRELGGDLLVKSVVGKGTTVTLILPSLEGEQAGAA